MTELLTRKEFFAILGRLAYFKNLIPEYTQLVRPLYERLINYNDKPLTRQEVGTYLGDWFKIYEEL